MAQCPSCPGPRIFCWSAAATGDTCPICGASLFDDGVCTTCGGIMPQFNLHIFASLGLTTTPPTGKHVYNEGTEVTLSVQPEPGIVYDFCYVRNDDTLVIYTENRSIFTLTMNNNYTLSFWGSTVDGEPIPPEGEFLPALVGVAAPLATGIALLVV